MQRRRREFDWPLIAPTRAVLLSARVDGEAVGAALASAAAAKAEAVTSRKAAPPLVVTVSQDAAAAVAVVEARFVESAAVVDVAAAEENGVPPVRPRVPLPLPPLVNPRGHTLNSLPFSYRMQSTGADSATPHIRGPCALLICGGPGQWTMAELVGQPPCCRNAPDLPSVHAHSKTALPISLWTDCNRLACSISLLYVT